MRGEKKAYPRPKKQDKDYIEGEEFGNDFQGRKKIKGKKSLVRLKEGRKKMHSVEGGKKREQNQPPFN